MKDLFLTYLNAGFFGSVIILVGVLLRPLLKRVPRRIVCIVWLLAAVRLLMPFDWKSDFSLQPQYVPSTTILGAQETQPERPAETIATLPVLVPTPTLPEIDTETIPSPPDTPALPDAPTIPDRPFQPAPEQNPVVSKPAEVADKASVTEKKPDVVQVLSVLWTVGSVGILGYGLMSYLVLKRRVRMAVRCADGVMECERINSAFLLGYFKPKIYLPTGLSLQDRSFIIAHEQMHKKRGDHWWKLLGLLCVAIHWYHPAVWLGYFLMCRDIEIACDEQVVQSMGLEERKAYSYALLNSGKRLSGVMICPVAFGEVGLKQRIKKVLANRKAGFWMTAIAIALVAFMALSLLTSPTVDTEAADDTRPVGTQPSAGTEGGSDIDDIDPPATQPTDPPATQPTEPPATQPTEPPSTQPTLPPEDEPAVDSNIIDEGYIDAGPARWKVTVDGTLTIYGAPYVQEVLEIDPYPWHQYADIVTKIVIADEVISIPHYAFRGMYMAQTVYLSKNLTTIDYGAFAQCVSLKEVVIPAGVKVIPEKAFYGCTSLSKLEFAPGCQLETIGKYAFAKTGLTSFSSPASLWKIDFYAFEDCYSMQYVILQGGVGEVWYHAFRNCTALKHVVLGESVRYAYRIFEGCNAIETAEIYSAYSDAVFANNPSLRSIIIGGKVRNLFDFSDCTALTDVKIDAPIETVDTYAFEGCTSLKSITLPETVTTIRAHAFSNSGLTKIVIPSSVKEIERYAFENSPIEEIVFIGDCPKMTGAALAKLTATVYYPAENDTWAKLDVQSFSDELTWVPYTKTESEGAE